MNLQAGGRDPRWDRAGPSRRGLGPRPLVWGAFTASAVLHAFVILIYPSLFPEIFVDGEGPISAGPPVPAGIQVMRVIEIDVPEEVQPPDEPELEAVQERAMEVVRPRGPDSPVVDLARPGITAADILRPNLTDARLWAPLPREFRELTLEQREELALAGRLAEWYDSVAASAAAEAAWTDWTFTDGDGDRWGIADGQLFLGGLAIPLPSFAPPPGAARERAWVWDEIARQGQAVAVQQTVRERMEAIRARRDRERAEARGDTTGAPR